MSKPARLSRRVARPQRSNRLRIELLHFEGCPGSAKALSILEEALAEDGISAEVKPVVIGSEDRFDSPGSPTILVNGKDLLPVEERPDTHEASCRIYATPEGPKNYPTVAMVREALTIRRSEEQPTNSRS
jgi:hypothetical protein